MNAETGAVRPVVFAAGAAHVDRRGRCDGVFVPGASNPGIMTEAVGGAVFNASRALRGLGAEVRLVSVRGGDRDGEIVRETLRDLGIDDLALTWLDRRTPTYTAILDEAGDLLGGLADMALYDLMQPRVFERRHLREELASAEVLFLDANLPAATIARLVTAVDGKLIAAIGVSPAKVGRLAGVLPRITLLFLSRMEAAALVGAPASAGMRAIAEALMKKSCVHAVVTDGPRAAAVIDGDRLRWQEPPLVAALRDVTGAGDTLAAVATHAFATGAEFLDAARLGMAAASLHISAEPPVGDFSRSSRRAAVALAPAKPQYPEGSSDTS